MLTDSLIVSSYRGIAIFVGICLIMLVLMVLYERLFS